MIVVLWGRLDAFPFFPSIEQQNYFKCGTGYAGAHTVLNIGELTYLLPSAVLLEEDLQQCVHAILLQLQSAPKAFSLFSAAAQQKLFYWQRHERYLNITGETNYIRYIFLKQYAFKACSSICEKV